MKFEIRNSKIERFEGEGGGLLIADPAVAGLLIEEACPRPVGFGMGRMWAGGNRLGYREGVMKFEGIGGSEGRKGQKGPKGRGVSPHGPAADGYRGVFS